MVFNSLQYAAFFPAVLALYWSLRHRGQNLLLLAASWFFYATFDWRFLGLMLVSTVTDYTVGRLLAQTSDERRRRLIFLLSLVVNLGILGFFKYSGFFIDSAERTLDKFGLNPGLPVLTVALPVGISFYTFHGISYTFDVFRRHIEPAKDFLTFACFVAYFPQLVAGPIGRAHIQLPQFEHPRRRPSARDVGSGVFLILLGLFKKVAIADALATYVNTAFADVGRAGWVTLATAMFAFALQIYGDFCGYTDIARGSSRLLGIELLVNFRQPYLSRNITEFWQRWHISLSTWLRDYLYVPLGGNRGSRIATYRNLILTMLLGGLWHGAAWTFVIWGLGHGVLLALHRRARAGHADIARADRPWSAGRDLLPTAATFTVVAALFVVFRASSLAETRAFFEGLLTLRAGPVDANAVITLVYAAVALFAIDLFQRVTDDEAPILAWRPAPSGALLGVMAALIIVFSGGSPVPFIYFRF